jgi:hypothetical protein
MAKGKLPTLLVLCIHFPSGVAKDFLEGEIRKKENTIFHQTPQSYPLLVTFTNLATCLINLSSVWLKSLDQSFSYNLVRSQQWWFHQLD